MKRKEFPFVLRDYAYEKTGLKDTDIRTEFTDEDMLASNKEEQTKYVNIAEEVMDIDDVKEYDKNINNYVDKISVDSLRYYQYVSVLLTEFILDEMSNRKSEFYEDMKDMCREKYEDVLPYLGENEDDLNKLAFSMATGSGKTIILQINVLQYRKHFDETEYQNIILVTPNERITRQHVESIDIDGIDVREYYGMETEKDTIHVAHIQRLNSSLNIGAKNNILGSDNLVLIDEGHRGLSSTEGSWLGTREEMYRRGGFCFEYSATLINPISSTERDTIGEYARSIIYDYSFGKFRDDGYGKKPRIVNLNQEGIPRSEKKWIILNTVKHYEKLLRYNNNRNEAYDYNIARPLMLLAGSTIDDDLVKYVKCMLDLINEERWLMDFFDDLLNQREKTDVDELVRYLDELDADLEFRYLSDNFSRPNNFVRSIKKHLFNSQTISELEVTRHMNGEGEVTLSDPESKDSFGLITVGESNAIRIQDELSELESVTDNTSMTNFRLFDNIDSKSSSTNILIGTTKFARGWDSNRPSSIGFLNIGSTEGPTVVQMFGRGVRLQGKYNDGKRINMNSSHPMVELQKLDVFGVKANYIDTFRDSLKGYDQGLTESIDRKTKEIDLQTQKDKKLSEVSLPVEEIGEVKPKKVSKLVDEISDDSRHFYPVNISRTYELESLDESTEYGATVDMLNLLSYNNNDVSIDIFDWNSIYYDILKYKRENSMSEIIVTRECLKKIVRNGRTLYQVEALPSMFDMKDKSDLDRIESLILEILKEVINSLYDTMQNEVAGGRLIEDEDKIVNDYIPEKLEISIDQEHKDDIGDDIEKIRDANKEELEESDSDLIPIVHYIGEGYYPIFESKQVIQGDEDNEDDEDGENDEDEVKKKAGYIQRIDIEGIDFQSEKDFIDEFEKLYDEENNFADLPIDSDDVILMRNQSRSGVGFSTAGNYYPDFVLWMFHNDQQYISFIDPKGLSSKVDGNKNKKKIKLCRRIRELFDDKDVDVSSYIYTNTGGDNIDYSLFDDFEGNNPDDRRRNANTYRTIDSGEGVKSIINDILD